MTTTMNRSDRRVLEQKQVALAKTISFHNKRKAVAKKTGTVAKKTTAGLGIATLLMASFAGVASAADQQQGDGVSLTSPEAIAQLSSYMQNSGSLKMQGETTASISDADKAQLAAVGVTLNENATAEAMNTIDPSHNTQDNVKLVFDFDDAVMRASADSKKLTTILDARLTVGDGYTPRSLNITTKENAGVEGLHTKGEVIDSMFFGGTPLDYTKVNTDATNTLDEHNFTTDTNSAWGPVSRFPVSSVESGGLLKRSFGSNDDINDLSAYVSTTVVDAYSDGNSDKRMNDVSLNGTQRTLNPDTAINCVDGTAECGFWFQVIATGSADGNMTLNDNGTPIAGEAVVLTDPIWVSTETTYSAGKTPTATEANPIIQVDGDTTTKLWATPVGASWSESFLVKDNAIHSTWRYDAATQEQIAELKANDVPVGTADLQYISVREGQNSTALWNIARIANSGAKVTSKSVPGQFEGDAASTEVTFTGEITNWLRNGEALTVGQTWSAFNENFTVVSVEDGKLVLNMTSDNDQTGVEWISEGYLNTGGNWVFPSHGIAQTPSYKVSYTTTTTPPVVEEKDPTALPDFVSGKHGSPIVIDPFANDTTSDASWTKNLSSLRIKDPADNKFKKTVTVDGEGTFEVQKDGKVVFNGVDGFHGDSELLPYNWDEVKHEVNDGVNEGLVGKTASSTLQVNVIKPVIPEDEPTIPTPDDSTIPNEEPEETPEETPENTPDKSTITKDEPTNDGGGDEVVENNDGGGQNLKIENDGNGADLAESGASQVFGKIAKALTLLGAGGIVALISKALISRTRKNRETSTND